MEIKENTYENELKRIFICLTMPNNVVKEVSRVQEQLRNKLQFVGKTTEPENLHLTLKFLGEINYETLEKVKEKLKNISFKSLNLKLGHVGAFSYKNMPRIIWIKVLGDAAKVQKQVDECLKDIFPIGERFMSHLTIARVKYLEDIRHAKDYLKHLRLPEISWTENKIYLNESVLKITGPVYAALEEYSAKD